MEEEKSTPKKAFPPGTHRPIRPIDWDLCAQYFRARAGVEQTAAALGFSKKQLNIRCKKEQGCTTAEFMQKCRDDGAANILKAQYEAALAGDSKMLMWFGKNYLGQSDKLEQTLLNAPAIDWSQFSTDDLKKALDAAD